MRRRQAIARTWLVTDERMGDALMPALARLPHGGGVLFRHYGLAPAERRALFGMVRDAARRRHQMLSLAGPPALARAWGADGWHGPHRADVSARGLLHSRSAHDPAELQAADQAGADFIFLSPAFPTWSHPGASALGPIRFAMLARATRLPVIALGGMDAARGRRLSGSAYGWAGIDAWSES